MSMSYHIETCPTCHRSDAQCVDRPSHCTDPWHGDDHLRCGPITQDSRAEQKLEIGPDTLRKAADVRNATTIRMRAETSRRCFEEALEHFVAKWAPERCYGRDRDYFQRDLMMLMRDAMQHQSGVFSMHMEQTESTMHASGSLNAIFKEKP